VDSGGLEIWGGIECTVCRIQDTFYDQTVRSGHEWRIDDLDRIASLGVTHLRYPVLWERVAPRGVGSADWSWTDERLERLRELGITPIVTLLHHGSGPAYTNLLDDEFPAKLARFADAVAARYPWIRYVTPVNEPLTTARFSALYGWWYPHAKSETNFYRALFNQLRGIRTAMERIRERIPDAQLVVTEDLGKTYSTPQLAYQTEHENARRFLSYDLLCGAVERNAEMRAHLSRLGFAVDSLERECRCDPDVLGYNYYVTGERWLDERLDRYPTRFWGGNGHHRYADVEAVRVCVESIAGPGALLQECWDRYGRTMAITEAHIACTREEQVRWLRDIYSDLVALRERSVDVRAMTVWSLLGAFDWNSALTRQDGYYESGAFDVSSVVPKETAVAAYVRALSGRPARELPACDGAGWWRLPSRLQFEPTFRTGSGKSAPQLAQREPCRMLAILGDGHPLAQALRRACAVRNLPVSDRDEGNAWAVVDCTTGRTLNRPRETLMQDAHSLLDWLMDSGRRSVRIDEWLIAGAFGDR
jgi:dTDP-4-dehydrorhamnose reductase